MHERSACASPINSFGAYDPARRLEYRQHRHSQTDNFSYKPQEPRVPTPVFLRPKIVERTKNASPYSGKLLVPTPDMSYKPYVLGSSCKYPTEDAFESNTKFKDCKNSWIETIEYLNSYIPYLSASLSVVSGGNLVTWDQGSMTTRADVLIFWSRALIAVFCTISLPLTYLTEDETKVIKSQKCICDKKNSSLSSEIIRQRGDQGGEKHCDVCKCLCFNCNTPNWQRNWFYLALSVPILLSALSLILGVVYVFALTLASVGPFISIRLGAACLPFVAISIGSGSWILKRKFNRVRALSKRDVLSE